MIASLLLRLKSLAVVAGIAVLSGLTLNSAVAGGAPETPPHVLTPKTEALYPVLEIEWKALFADHVGFVRSHYMTGHERERFRVVIERGVVYTSQGDVFPDASATDHFIYVMDAAGNFYVGNQTLDPKLHHSSFFAGKPVAAAGEIQISKGTITMINRSSGHYKPGLEAFQRVLDELQRDGVEIEPLRSGGNR